MVLYSDETLRIIGDHEIKQNDEYIYTFDEYTKIKFVDGSYVNTIADVIPIMKLDPGIRFDYMLRYDSDEEEYKGIKLPSALKNKIESIIK